MDKFLIEICCPWFENLQTKVKVCVYLQQILFLVIDQWSIMTVQWFLAITYLPRLYISIINEKVSSKFQ
jgi:hypothetical protein